MIEIRNQRPRLPGTSRRPQGARGAEELQQSTYEQQQTRSPSIGSSSGSGPRHQCRPAKSKQKALDRIERIDRPGVQKRARIGSRRRRRAPDAVGLVGRPSGGKRTRRCSPGSSAASSGEPGSRSSYRTGAASRRPPRPRRSPPAARRPSRSATGPDRGSTGPAQALPTAVTPLDHSRPSVRPCPGGIGRCSARSACRARWRCGRSGSCPGRKARVASPSCGPSVQRAASDEPTNHLDAETSTSSSTPQGLRRRAAARTHDRFVSRASDPRGPLRSGSSSSGGVRPEDSSGSRWPAAPARVRNPRPRPTSTAEAAAGDRPMRRRSGDRDRDPGSEAAIVRIDDLLSRTDGPRQGAGLARDREAASRGRRAVRGVGDPRGRALR